MSDGIQVLFSRAGRVDFTLPLAKILAPRLEQHHSGISKWTKSRGPWSLVWRHDFQALPQIALYLRRRKNRRPADASPMSAQVEGSGLTRFGGWRDCRD
jgi:hypothetical protein